MIPTHKLGRCFLCVCCVLVRCVWVFAVCVCVLKKKIPPKKKETSQAGWVGGRGRSQKRATSTRADSQELLRLLLLILCKTGRIKI